MKYSNIHTHTTFSDGKNTVAEMAEQAVSLGFCSIGFSDHSEMLSRAGQKLNLDAYTLYRDGVAEGKKAFEGEIEILFGVEKDAVSEIPWEMFEYVIGSVHFLEMTEGLHPIDLSLKQQEDFIRDCCRGNSLEYAKRYYEQVALHAQKCPFQVQGHFDLVNKFGVFDGAGEDYRHVALEALDEVLACVPYIEVNTGAISRGYRREPYPEDFLLKRILEKGGKLVLNGDSHKAEHLDTHFDESVEKLKKIGFRSFWQLRENGFVEVPFDQV